MTFSLDLPEDSDGAQHPTALADQREGGSFDRAQPGVGLETEAQVCGLAAFASERQRNGPALERGAVQRGGAKGVVEIVAPRVGEFVEGPGQDSLGGGIEVQQLPLLIHQEDGCSEIACQLAHQDGFEFVLNSLSRRGRGDALGQLAGARLPVQSEHA